MSHRRISNPGETGIENALGRVRLRTWQSLKARLLAGFLHWFLGLPNLHLDHHRAQRRQSQGLPQALHGDDFESVDVEFEEGRLGQAEKRVEVIPADSDDTLLQLAAGFTDLMAGRARARIAHGERLRRRAIREARTNREDLRGDFVEHDVFPQMAQVRDKGLERKNPRSKQTPFCAQRYLMEQLGSNFGS